MAYSLFVHEQEARLELGHGVSELGPSPSEQNVGVYRYGSVDWKSWSSAWGILKTKSLGWGKRDSRMSYLQ